MLKLILVLLACVVGAWVLVLLVTLAFGPQVARQTWPDGLGSIEDVPKRYPPHPENAAAREVTKLLVTTSDRPFKDISHPLRDWLIRQQQRTDTTVEPAPPAVAAYLTSHDAPLAALRDRLLRDDPIEWRVDLSRGLDAPLPNLVGHMALTRLFIARALTSGNWEELHAAWNLDRGLWRRSELLSVIVALATTRMIAASARVLPLPPPSWLNEMSAVDARHAFLAGFQEESWMLWAHGHEALESRALVLVLLPWIRTCNINAIQHRRRVAEELARITSCDFDRGAFHERHLAEVPRWNTIERAMFPDLGFDRPLRLRAELELLDRALHLRAGAPIVARSQCSDGVWIYEPKRVRFSKRMQPPLAFSVP